MWGEIEESLRLNRGDVTVIGRGRLGSVFAVTDLAVASVGAAGAALATLVAAVAGGTVPEVRVDRALASNWFASSIRPVGWELTSAWDSVAGDYRGADGWIRLHTNAQMHRAAALRVLGVEADRTAVAASVSAWAVEDLENAVVEAGGAAAVMRSLSEWSAHPQGRTVAGEPLLHHEVTAQSRSSWHPSAGAGRPLGGLRVLDMTRVLAGPVATRTLAGWGADVLRIDPPCWEEPGLAPEVTVGKRCARLDLRQAADRQRWWHLLDGADVLVHGYRPWALDGLGLGPAERDEHLPGLVEVSLDAYGWSGPWNRRRGFDSLVQMSSGIAHAGQAAAGTDRPVPLPVQALDQATGYLMAGAVLTGLLQREQTGFGSRWRTSLARTAKLLIDAGQRDPFGEPLEPGSPIPDEAIEQTPWGVAHRSPPPLVVAGAPLRWIFPARPLGYDVPEWPA